MKIEHTLTITAVCPVDLKSDVYTCVVRTNRIIPIETILEAVAKSTAEPAYQEDLATRLHRVLAVEVELIGWHSGVLTRVIAGGAP